MKGESKKRFGGIRTVQFGCFNWQSSKDTGDAADEIINFSNGYSTRDESFLKRMKGAMLEEDEGEADLDEPLYYCQDSSKRGTNFVPWRKEVPKEKGVRFETRVPYPINTTDLNCITFLIVMIHLSGIFNLIKLEDSIDFGDIIFILTGVYKIGWFMHVSYVTLNYFIHSYEMHCGIKKELSNKAVDNKFRFQKWVLGYFWIFGGLLKGILRYLLLSLLIYCVLDWLLIELMNFSVIMKLV